MSFSKMVQGALANRVMIPSEVARHKGYSPQYIQYLIKIARTSTQVSWGSILVHLFVHLFVQFHLTFK
ncbi:hypothetical protein Back11_11970 [Paenibacillus baekrokdamisoli]|uniref:Uncharacterized protein n=1 Tax=Paenibacillus baekrokdamisoli TaxID=1712516 RepID=A0A3G9INP2_9BACL|nr:hypothetical protein [Paenibacillus baekrokdamisoli]MBB3070502.1 hypothetical protein [Paenibacillus baekrokdamisoli]BBH19852.1 hypothetical protein Back11_11970 [Paenibacillus baekrokdamisoli]